MVKCQLCHSDKKDDVKYGEFIEKHGVSAHTYCLYLSSGLVQNGNEDNSLLGFLPADIKAEENRVSKLICYYCHKPYANVGCCESKCRRTFHFICGTENKAENQFVGTFRSYCHSHQRKEYKRPPAKDELCCICYDTLVDRRRVTRFNGVIKAPCCRSGWFHKWCLQSFACSAGYFFKCPLCNDVDKFRVKLPFLGIFIPDRDAEWELEPNAFAELLERPNTCSADVCNNKNGRENTNTRDPFLYCNTCGSVAIHKLCLPERVNAYTCTECKQIVPTEHSSVDRDSGRESFETFDEEDEIVDVCSFSDTSDIDYKIQNAAQHRKRTQMIIDSSDDEEIIEPVPGESTHKKLNEVKEDNENESENEADIVNPPFRRKYYNAFSSDDERTKTSPVNFSKAQLSFQYDSSDTDDIVLSNANSQHSSISGKVNSTDESELDVNKFMTIANNILMRKRKISDSTSLSETTKTEESNTDEEADPLENFQAALNKKAKLTKRRDDTPLSYAKQNENKTKKMQHYKETNGDNGRRYSSNNHSSSCKNLNFAFSDSSNSSSDLQHATASKNSSISLNISCVANRTRHRKSALDQASNYELKDSPKPENSAMTGFNAKNNTEDKKDVKNILEISCVANRTRRKSIYCAGKTLTSILEELEPTTPNSNNTPKNSSGAHSCGYKVNKRPQHIRRLMSSPTEDLNDDDVMKTR